MSEYRKIVLQLRKRVSKLTLEQQKQILKLYNDTITDLSRKAASPHTRELTRVWAARYAREVEKAKIELKKELNKQIRGSIKKGAEIGTEAEQLIMHKIFKLAGIKVDKSFNSMFAKVQDNVVHGIISGNLYKDNKTLSARIWSYGEGLEEDIQYIINQAIIQKKSAIELAKDLEKYVKDPAKRGTNWNKVYPDLVDKAVDYNAMRLARTSINHAYQTATIQSSNMNPFVVGIQWWAANIHGRTCELCMERHEKVFPKDNVPLDHPNGLCAMIPHIPKSSIEVADELRAWLDGEDNKVLDEWYNKYGDYFAYKKI